MSKEYTTDIGQRIDRAKKSLEQQRNRLRQLEARKSAHDRKERTRKLILAGAVVMTKAEKDEAFRADLMRWLDDGIPENRNRVLFDLAERPGGTQSDAGQSERPGKSATMGGSGEA